MGRFGLTNRGIEIWGGVQGEVNSISSPRCRRPKLSYIQKMRGGTQKMQLKQLVGSIDHVLRQDPIASPPLQSAEEELLTKCIMDRGTLLSVLECYGILPLNHRLVISRWQPHRLQNFLRMIRC